MKKWIGLLALSGLALVSAQDLPLPVDCSFDMGSKRRNWNHARWKVVAFATPLDARNLQGLRIQVNTDTPNPAAGVTVALQEADGSWFSVPQVVDLVKAQNSGELYFSDLRAPAYFNPPGGSFKDENGQFDTDNLKAIAFGVVNPLGIGKVEFSVTAVQGIQAVDANLPPLEIKVGGALWEVNGTDTLPAGVFGGFNLKNTRDPATGQNIRRLDRYRLALDRQIDFSRQGQGPAFGKGMAPSKILSVGDRTQSSLRFTDPNWKQNYDKWGRSLGSKVKASGRSALVEFWNEPYLNWANDNRVNFDPKFFRRGEAKEGAAVTLAIDGTELPHLKWTKDFSAPPWNWTRAGRQEWRRGRNEKGKSSVWQHARPYKIAHHQWRKMMQELNPKDSVADGETYQAKGQSWTAFTPWHVYDETQFTYWSGKGMLLPYIDPLLAYAGGIKATAGDAVTVIAGWGMRPSEDHWDAFHLLYKPTIDAAVGVIDAYNDHDYGADPRVMAANYEVVTGYAMANHGKWLVAYNTETASNADPQTRSGQVQLSGNADKFRWVTHKIANLLDYSPDKCKGLLHFGVGGGFWSDGGEGVAMDLMRELRGRLLYSYDTHPDVHVVTSVDGTDPLAPKPSDLPEAQQQVTLLFNASPELRVAKLSNVPAPGTRFNNAVLRTANIGETGKVELVNTPVRVQANGYPLEIELKPGIPVLLINTLEGTLKEQGAPTVRTRQIFGKEVLEEVTAAAPKTMSLNIGNLQGLKRARLRFVAERLSRAEGWVEVNGTRLELPAAVAPENGALVRELELDPALLKATTELRFGVQSDDHAGYRLGVASVIVDAM